MVIIHLLRHRSHPLSKRSKWYGIPMRDNRCQSTPQLLRAVPYELRTTMSQCGILVALYVQIEFIPIVASDSELCSEPPRHLLV